MYPEANGLYAYIFESDACGVGIMIKTPDEFFCQQIKDLPKVGDYAVIIRENADDENDFLKK